MQHLGQVGQLFSSVLFVLICVGLCSGGRSVQHLYLCLSAFNCVHLYPSLFVCVQADIVCNILDNLGSCVHLCLTVSIFVHLCSGGHSV